MNNWHIVGYIANNSWLLGVIAVLSVISCILGLLVRGVIRSNDQERESYEENLTVVQRERHFVEVRAREEKVVSFLLELILQYRSVSSEDKSKKEGEIYNLLIDWGVLNGYEFFARLMLVLREYEPSLAREYRNYSQFLLANLARAPSTPHSEKVISFIRDEGNKELFE